MSRYSVFVALALAAAGCSNEPERGPVSGIVTLDGKPLSNVVVVFVPDVERGTPGQRSVATTDKEGRYIIFTDKYQSGASVGIHRVSLYDPEAFPRAAIGMDMLQGKENEPPREPKAPPPSRVPAVYTNVMKTPLQPVEVGRAAQTYDIHLKSK